MLYIKICELRKRFHLSQEEMAHLFGVSRQAVQKWETGAAMPEIENLIAIAKHFQVSLDQLLLHEEDYTTEVLRVGRKIVPKYETLHEWESYASQLRIEYRQSLEEGRDIASYKKLFDAVDSLPAGQSKEKLANTLFEMVMDAYQQEDYPYNEPSSLEDIRKFLPARTGKLTPHGPDLPERIRGAWLGRICGCLLGKPIEGIYTEELLPLLKETNNYPMHRYILASDLHEGIYARYSFGLRGKCYADTIPSAPVDDDTNYTVLAMELVQKHGRNFTSGDVAQMWVDKQSKNAYCTAERVAFRNFINGYLPPDSAEYKNPYREWIGALIRGDYYGYINPGNPAAAAEMAWRDASISHTKNGIYGEMFVAAMLAAAAVTQDAVEVIRCGLSQVPGTSRLHKRIEAILDRYLRKGMAEECLQDITHRYDEHDQHDWCHVLSNAEIVTYALLYGEMDYGRTICMAVQAGFDTDCNGATAGSVLGMMLGAAGIPKTWTDPIHNRLSTSIFGVECVDIDDLVSTTLRHLPVL